MKFKFSLFSLILLLFAASCETYPQDDYEQYYVVESYQVGGRAMSEVRLSTTAPADEFYDFTNQAVDDAQVEVHLLAGGPGSAVEETFTFSPQEPGIYFPDQPQQVLNGRTYELNISMPSGERIKAHTIVPGGFEILGGVQDTVLYQSSEQLEITVTPSYYPGRQNIFIFNSIALEPTVENLTPFFRDVYEDGEEDVEFYAKNSSNIINEGNFDANADGTFTLKYPWIGIAFYGENLLVTNTIDDNIYDFVRSQGVQLGGSTLSPGEIQNAIDHVEGGIGVFGSLASDTVSSYIKRFPVSVE